MYVSVEELRVSMGMSDCFARESRSFVGKLYIALLWLPLTGSISRERRFGNDVSAAPNADDLHRQVSRPEDESFEMFATFASRKIWRAATDCWGF